MGMSTGGSPEINVTPLIDVLLVLLVIFLIIMPVMIRLETVELPQRSDTPSEGVTMVVKLDADLSVSIDDGAQFPYRELARRLRDQLAKVSAVFVDSVDVLPWGLVVSTVDTIRGVANDVNGRDVKVAIRIRDE